MRLQDFDFLAAKADPFNNDVNFNQCQIIVESLAKL